MPLADWEFWIDVGGTFTDCFARAPSGELRRHKVLSSGVTKGATGAGSSVSQIVDASRRHDPAGCWNGYQVRLLDSAGRSLAETTVEQFEPSSGVLRLSAPFSIEPQGGQAYELFSDEAAPIVAIRYLLGLSRQAIIPPLQVRLGTTRGTNALLTRQGASVALVTTRGFGDILHIGYQDRPRLFDLHIVKRIPLFTAVVEIDERVTAAGQVLRAPQPDIVRNQLAELRASGVQSLAICLLHASTFSAHESLVAEIAREVGFAEISVSSQVAPLVKLVPRGDTTVMDAYLNPVLRRYVESLRAALPGSQLRLLTSAGGLVGAEQFAGKDSILSGPAGGVVGFSRVAQAAGFSQAIGFDMGGTSTDVSRFDGRYDLQFETEKAGVRVVAPMLAIETVAAGGGSLCKFDGVKLIVGPESGGADPGPACYGRGGPLTLTDMNFYLGRIPPERFPFPLERAPVTALLQSLAEEIQQATGRKSQPAELAAGFLQVANANMAQAIRSISLAKGCDPRQYVLVAFGGAAGQHACAVATELGIPQILSHPDAGLLSAYGIGLADVERHRVAGVYELYSAAKLREVDLLFEQLTAEAQQELAAEGMAFKQVEINRSLDLRYQGVDAYLTVPCPADGNYQAKFLAEHLALYGYVHEARPIEMVAARVEVRGRSSRPLPASTRVSGPIVQSARTTTVSIGGQLREAQIFDRADLKPGDRFLGPAIVCEMASTAVVDPGWQAEVLSQGELLIGAAPSNAIARQPSPAAAPQHDPDAAPDLVLLEVFNNRFAGIAEQMGITLRNTALSVNVKERLDFSCAIFTAAGDLVVNAPHIPVHLGAMSETVKRLIADNPRFEPGDVLVSNDPYRGGSHLPDVTVVTPVHDDAGRVLFFTASRAHHAEIGGLTPGSMPPFSRNLAEEGVLIQNFELIDAGRPRWDALRDLLLSGPFPTRDVEANLADIAAQVAANRQGARDLLALAAHYTLPVVTAYMRHIQDAAEAKTRRALARLPSGKRTFTDYLDDGSPITVTATIDGGRATFDFTGTGPVLPGNLNANRAIVTAAVMYVLRCLLEEDIPLNQGVLAPVDIVLPECLLNPPERTRPQDCAAVVGGNVETSQRVVDVLLGALGLAAASQGTMNNLLFGDGSFGYYETICGGSGATARGPGADAVHTHMTNTRLTDPEVLERRFPARVLQFSIRPGSGGAGRHRGGHGVIRRIEFLRELDVSIISQRRGPAAPYGIQGGQPGALGRNTLRRADGAEVALPAFTQFEVHAGDQLTLETPGAGGWGELDEA